MLQASGLRSPEKSGWKKADHRTTDVLQIVVKCRQLYVEAILRRTRSAIQLETCKIAGFSCLLARLAYT
jgi:hypothetical protein